MGWPSNSDGEGTVLGSSRLEHANLTGLALLPYLSLAKPEIIFLKLSTKVYSLIWPHPSSQAPFLPVQFNPEGLSLVHSPCFPRRQPWQFEVDTFSLFTHREAISDSLPDPFSGSVKLPVSL